MKYNQYIKQGQKIESYKMYNSNLKRQKKRKTKIGTKLIENNKHGRH